MYPVVPNVIPDALFQRAELIMSIIVDSDLLPQIRNIQEPATGEIQLQLKQFAEYEE